MTARIIRAPFHFVGQRIARQRLFLSISIVLLFFHHSALAATVSLKAFDRIAEHVELDYVLSGTDEVRRLPMERQVFGVWQVDFQVPAGDYEYRFVTDGEAMSDIGNAQFNRRDDGSIWSLFSVHDGNDTYSNYRISTPVQRSGDLFHVAVTYDNPQSKSVLVAGEFNGWDPEPMQRIGDGKWGLGFDLEEGTYAYKFIVDGNWILDPVNGLLKQVNGIENSAMMVSSNTAVDPESLYESEEPENTSAKVNVRFRFYAPLATEVALVGTFNHWNGEKNRMSRRGAMWEYTLPLHEGTYEYKFKVGPDWFWDPDKPPQAPGGNSVITVKRQAPPSKSRKAVVQPEQWEDVAQILLEPSTGLHAFQQELVRAYVYIVGRDQYGLKMVDGSLLNPDQLPANPAARWGWSMDQSDGRSMMTLAIASNTVAFELKHPLLSPPRKWLAEQRKHAEKIFKEVSLDWLGPSSPPTNSAWATARAELHDRRPFSDVHAVNLMTEFGRTQGWSPELLREIAVTYADMATDYGYPGIGGWAPVVFAARAVVYADLARSGHKTDETMAYVLCRIGRPGDGAAFLPSKPKTFHGQLAAAMARGEPEQLLTWAGSSDHYGLDVPEGQPTNAPTMSDFSPVQKAQVLSTLADLLYLDGQDSLSSCYLNASLRFVPLDFARHVRALRRGGVSAGHIHVHDVLNLAGCHSLWTSVLEGSTPVLCDDVLPRRSFMGNIRRGTPSHSVAEEVAEISSLYRDKQRALLDGVTEAVPESARLLMLRDMLNIAWWQNARFFGASLSSQSGCQRLNQIMATWRPFQPEMEAFTRFKMRRPMKDHAYTTIRRGFTSHERKPDTLAYIRMTKEAFGTWLMEEAQSFYPRMPTVQSDVYADYQSSVDVYIFQGMNYLRANFRRLNPMSPEGYPAPGPLPKPGGVDDIPKQLLGHSYELNRRLAKEWSHTFDKESQEAAIAFYKRCMEIAPGEIDTYRDYADILMDNGQYQEAIALAESCPDTMEGLKKAAMYRLATYAALELGDTNRALSFAKSSANSWQGASLRLYAYVLEVTGSLEESEAIHKAANERYAGHGDIYMLLRQWPERAEERATELLSWIEQFPDLDQAREDNRFSFNELKSEPYIYAALDRWDRALWLLKPLSEAVQNDFIWFALMAVGQKTGDQTAMELGQHVLATHVFNAWGDFARFMRHQTTWEEVLNAARNEGRPQPMYYLAGVIAEQRGDTILAVRLYKQALDPRFSTQAWFTMAWRALTRLGHDPMAFVQRTFPAHSDDTQ